jgi:hypothetical protein
MDIAMLLYPGGMERVVDEYGALFDAAGFKLTSVKTNVVDGERD